MAFHFTGECDGCSACVRQCPTDAIFGAFLERYDVDPNACIECGVCGWICPIDAVRDGAGSRAAPIPRDRRPRPVVTADLCNGCKLCVDFCPFECMAITGERYAGVSYLAEPEICVSCGECRQACIKGAIEMRPIDIRRFDVRAEAERLRTYLGEPNDPATRG